jgi:hypothetical protein
VRSCRKVSKLPAICCPALAVELELDELEFDEPDVAAAVAWVAAVEIVLMAVWSPHAKAF